MIPQLSDDTDREYLALREASGLVTLDHFRVIELTGDDRKGWLQGQSTNELRSMVPGTSISFCMCSPTGQLEAICGLWALSDRFLIVTHRDAVPAFMKRVETMVILENVEAKVLEGTLLSVQGPTATQTLGELVQLPNLDSGFVEFKKTEAIVLRSNRTGFGGWDVFFPGPSKVGPNALKKSFPAIGRETFSVAALEYGIPEFGVDTDAKTLPPELGQNFESQNVNYHKGCYTGQEVLQRIHSRGHTNRTWCALILDGPIPPGTTLSKGQRDQIGTVTRSAFSPEFGWIGAAILRNEFAAEGEEVEAVVDGRTIRAEVAQMPLLRFN